MTNAFYIPDGELFQATPLTRGPWDDRFQHGGPPSALMAGALERWGADHEEWLLPRVSIELLRPVPITRLSLSASPIRLGRSVQRLEATLSAGNQVVARAMALRVRRTPLASPEDPRPLRWPTPEASESLEQYRAQVERIIEGWLVLAESHRPLVRLFHEQWSSVDLPRLQKLREEYVGYTERFLRNGLTRGFLRAGLDVSITAQMLTALVFEGSRAALETDDPAERARWKHAGLALMFDGIS